VAGRELRAWERSWAAAQRLARMALRVAEPRPRGPGWISDAVYGANDGLGAVFGIVAGVAGYSHGGRSGRRGACGRPPTRSAPT